MSTNYETQLRLAGSPIDPAFKGTPQQYYEEILRRTRILAPFGTGLFVTGSVMPTSNQGPWLKDGQQWWVWDNDSKTYIPLDISASFVLPFYIQDTEPPTDEGRYIWFQTNSNRILATYILVNGAWDPITATTGTTAERPATPRNLQEYYDTDIQALIWYERGKWRTKDGVRGDVKFVTWDTGEEALRRNPGWEILGTEELNGTQYRGRVIGSATKDKAGTAPSSATDLSAGGLTSREALSVAGGESSNVSLTEDNMPRHRHEIGMEDSQNPNTTDQDNTALGDPDAAGELAGDGANYMNMSPVPGPYEIAFTRYRGKATPDPVTVPIMQPTLYLFTLRKT